jgi:hypothetical protein
LPANRAVALNGAKPSADKQRKKIAAPPSSAAPKLAAAKPAAGAKPQSKPEARVVTAMKDQSRPQSGPNTAKPAVAADRSAKRIAAQ